MFTAQHLLTPPTKSDDPLQAPQLSGEALMKELIDRPVACAVRIGECPYLSFLFLLFIGFMSACSDKQFLSEILISVYVVEATWSRLTNNAASPRRLHSGYRRSSKARQSIGYTNRL